MIKWQSNERSDWFKQRALWEYKARCLRVLSPSFSVCARVQLMDHFKSHCFSKPSKIFKIWVVQLYQKLMIRPQVVLNMHYFKNSDDLKKKKEFAKIKRLFTPPCTIRHAIPCARPEIKSCLILISLKF